MFTNLDQQEILKAIIWLCYAHAGTEKKKRYRTRSCYRDTIYVQKIPPYECSWQAHNKDWLKLDYMDIIRVDHFDLHTFTSTAGVCFKQIRGAPIGGFLS